MIWMSNVHVAEVIETVHGTQFLPWSTTVRNDPENRVQLFEGQLAFNLGFFFLCSKAFSRISFSVIFKASNHQLVDKRIKIEMLFKLSNLNSNLALTLSFEQLRPVIAGSSGILFYNFVAKKLHVQFQTLVPFKNKHSLFRTQTVKTDVHPLSNPQFSNFPRQSPKLLPWLKSELTL